MTVTSRDEVTPKINEEIANFEEASNDAISEILNIVDVKKDNDPVDDANATLRNFFNNKEASLEDVAQNIVNVMCRGETDAGRLRAAEYIAKIHGISVELEEKKQSSAPVTINIIGSGESKSLINLVMPKK